MIVAPAYMQGLVPALGWTLAHFLWQGALVALALQVVLKACRTARARHDWALGALFVMAVLPVVTFAWLQAGVRIVLVPHGFPGLTPLAQRWETFAVAAWLAGVAALAVRMAGGLVLVERLRRSAVALPPEWTARCRALEQKIATPLAVLFAQSEAVATPIVAGWLKPMVLIPAGFLVRLPPAELEALILHELAHVRRLDAFANLIQSVVETALFYHPAVWWVSRRVRLEREQCCDDLAVAAVGDRALYVRALQSLETLRVPSHGVLAAGGGDLRRRAARILGAATAPERPALSRFAAMAILALGAGAMTQGAAVQAKPDAAPSKVPAAQVAAAASAGSASAPAPASAAPPPPVEAAPRIVLAEAETPAPLVLVPAVTPASTPVAEPSPVVEPPPAAPAELASNGPTVRTLVVSPKSAPKPDVEIQVGGFPNDAHQSYAQIWPFDSGEVRQEGHVVMTCRINVHGFAEQCAVMSEAPANLNFGKAALALRPTLRFAPAAGPDGPVPATLTIAVDYKARAPVPDAHPVARAVRLRDPDSVSETGLKFNTLNDPVWVRTASFDDLVAAYPRKAGGKEGYVVSACSVRKKDGALEGCYAIREEPEGRGFGLAAQPVLDKFRVSPEQARRQIPGQQLWVMVPVRFPSAQEMAERTVTAPKWVAGFDRSQAPKVYPPQAVAAGVTSGRGVARCTVGAGGALTDCAPEGAEPNGLGFSEAAAKLASTMRMSLWSGDATPVEGGVIHVPIRLNLKGAAEPSGASALAAGGH
ncbi:M56 family metallopeptidase [Phenylobacterium sp.]|uniref:M56 family metallopeptidase n=1 Tax=Phenylobacterium sp. TaxID=1871053 RepID=UPI0025E83AE7|nr:M56 family metallopeptidase [Phenylobacterium sp.]